MDTTTNKKWNKFDTAWVLNLFGTAVGAGYYFTNQCRDGRFWPLVCDGDFSRTDDIFCASWRLISCCLLLNQAVILLKW